MIARNGGERLSESLRSVLRFGHPVIYVDSDSSDDSIERARQLNVPIVQLTAADQPNAAKARNAGFEAMLKQHPDTRWIQFVDGDTTIDKAWPPQAAATVGPEARCWVVCGHLRERGREANAFRRVLDMDWAGPVGEIKGCGGNAMIRAAAFRELGGFDPRLPGGEEANLCERVRRAGGLVRRIDAVMGEHDSGIDTLARWWTRTERIGYWNARAAATGAAGHTDATIRRMRSAAFWAGSVPLMMCVAAVSTLVAQLPRRAAPAAVAMIGLSYLLLIVRIALRRGGDHAWLYAFFCVLAKFPQLQGQLRYRFAR